MPRFTFSKKERLCSRKIIGELFEKGKSDHHFPIRMVWLELPAEDEVPARVAVSVSKKTFKKAVDRNRIKRLMRESYRLNKLILEDYYKKNGVTLALLFIYTGKELTDFKEVQAKIILSLKRFQV